MIIPGQLCPRCQKGHLVVYCSNLKEHLNVRERYYWCSNESCRHKPNNNKIVIPVRHGNAFTRTGKQSTQ